MFLTDGDLSRNTEADQQRAIWEADPRNKVYFANYITTRSKNITTPQQLAHFEREVAIGEHLDPQNAFYHYLLADALMNLAVSNSATGVKFNEKTGLYTYAYRIKDRSMLDRAMREFRLGLAKPYLKTYHLAMIQTRLDALPSCRQFEDQMQKIGFPASMTMPEYARYHHLSIFAPYYARTLIAEGRFQQAQPFLEAWRPFAAQIAHSSEDLIGMLVAFAIASIGAKQDAQLYDEVGRHDLAMRTRVDLARVTAILDALKAGNKWREQEYARHWQKTACWSSGSMLEWVGDRQITNAELAPARSVEQVGIEEIANGALSLINVLLICFFLLNILRWRLLLHNDAATPRLPGLSWRDYLRVLPLSMGLPLLLYVIYSRYTGWSGREQNAFVISHRMITELVLLWFVIIAASIVPLSLIWRRRCRQLGFPVPSFALEALQGVPSGIFCAIGMIIIGGVTTKVLIWCVFHLVGRTAPPLNWLMLPAILIPVALNFLPMLWERCFARYGGYFAEQMHEEACYMAIITLIFILLLTPVLAANERALLHADHLFFYPGQQMGRGIIPLEEHLTNRLRTATLAALKGDNRSYVFVPATGSTGVLAQYLSNKRNAHAQAGS